MYEFHVLHYERNCRKNDLLRQIGYVIWVYFESKGAACRSQAADQDHDMEEGMGRVSPVGLVPEWTLTACL